MKPYYKIKNCSLYHCNNLNLMESLPENYIDLIYCDILYGTGRNFGDYQDLKLDRNIIEAHYVPRVKEMYRVLAKTGSMYLQMDTRINHWLRIICDDIFGYDNFRREIVWCYKSGGISKTDFPQKHDVIIKYSKTNKYKYQPEKIPYTESTLKRGNRCDNLYCLSNDGTPISDWWDDIKPIIARMDKERVGYQTQKPKKLLERIIKTSSSKNDIVADFYMGAGTTGEVSLELGRRFIGCDIGDRACNLSQERLSKLE